MSILITNKPGSGSSGGVGVAPTVQKFLSGSGTYNLPSPAPLYIQIEMVGGGGGGGGGANSGSTAGGSGGNTTFGPLTANGGSGGGAGTPSGGTGLGGAGGTASLGSGPIGLVLTGASGNSATALTDTLSASGGNSAFGGAGTGNNQNGGAGVTNAGGGGGGSAGTTSYFGGGGGGAGGYIEAIITSPSSSYSYSVGAAGSAGSGSATPGAGGSGVIIVTEYYSPVLVSGVLGISGGGTGATTVNGAVANLTPSSNSQVYLQAPNGHGSTNSTVRRWSTTITNTGSDITYADSATLGGSFTINTKGLYSIWADDQSNAGGAFFGFVKNGTQGSTSILSLSAPSSVLALGQVSSNIAGQVSTTVLLNVGDVIWLQDDGSLNYTNNAGRVSITRIL